MRYCLTILLFSLFSTAFSQVKIDEWTKLGEGVEYKWISKKNVQNTDFAILKLKVRNNTNKTIKVEFEVYEYEGVTPISRSEKETMCLKPNFVDVIKVQLLSKNAKNDSKELLLEFTDVILKEIESCSGK